MDQPFTAVNRNPSQLFFRLCVALRSEICKGYARFIFAYYQCIRRWFVSHIPFVVRKKKAVLHNGAGGVGRGFMREGEIFSIIMVSGTITLQRHAMNNARTVLLGFFLFVGALNSAMADSCRANIFGGQDCRYDDGSTSSSRSNIFGGQDTTYSDGRTSSSRENIFGGQDTKNSDGSASSSRANIFDGQDTQYSDGRTSTSRANIFDGQDTRYSDGRASTSRENIFGGQDTRNND